MIINRKNRRKAMVAAVATATASCLYMLPAGATLSGNGGTFNTNDGNLTVDTGEAHDWGTFVGKSVGSKVDSITLQANMPDEYKGSSNPDSSFVNGTKEDDSPPSVGTGGIPPNKDDFTRLYVASEHATTAGGDGKYHDFVYMGWERTNNPGTAFESFEFNQSKTLSSNGVTPVRSNGDVLVLYNLDNGGTVPTLFVSTWIKPGSNCDNTKDNGLATGCWQKRQAEDALGGEASINTGSTTDPITGATLATNTFGEAAIDLQAAGIFTSGSCKSFGSAMLASRSSSSVDATMKDYAGPAPVNITNCGTLSFTKADDLGNPLNGATFDIYDDKDADGTLSTGDVLHQPSTTLSADAAANSGTLTVTDAGAFPTQGKFSVFLGSSTTPLPVDSVSGNVLTLKTGTTHVAGSKNTTAVTWTGTCSPYSTDVTDPTKPATCTFDDLNNGRYLVFEEATGAPTGYTVDTTVWAPTISDTVKSGSKSFVDNRAPVDVTINKADDVGTAVPTCGSTIPTPPDCAGFTLYDDAAHSSKLTVAAAANDTSLTVADGTAFPASGAFTVIVESETLAVASRSGNVLTLTGKVGTAHLVGKYVSEVSPSSGSDTGKSCAATGTTGQCKFASVYPGVYIVAESTTPDGYVTAPAAQVVIALGDGAKTVNMTDPRLFKIITLVCTEQATGSFHSSTITYNGSSTSGSTPASGGTTLTATEEAHVCGLTGTYVLGDSSAKTLQKNDSSHPYTSSVVIP